MQYALLKFSSYWHSLVNNNPYPLLSFSKVPSTFRERERENIRPVRKSLLHLCMLDAICQKNHSFENLTADCQVVNSLILFCLHFPTGKMEMKSPSKCY